PLPGPAGLFRATTVDMVKLVAVVAALAIVTPGCVRRLERKVGPTLQTVDQKAPYLKVHMRDGVLYVLSDWMVKEAAKEIVGVGDKFRADRSLENAGTFRIDMSDVGMYETNTIITSPGVGALAV